MQSDCFMFLFDFPKINLLFVCMFVAFRRKGFGENVHTVLSCAVINRSLLASFAGCEFDFCCHLPGITF